ncbi:sigma-70 family RNA polymerase sigma factor [Gordonia otitidis]|nr:sigma-70 family RNA polymerase sigma factor [Gordonia otitidis]
MTAISAGQARNRLSNFAAELVNVHQKSTSQQHRMAHSYRADAQVSTWLHRIVVNACLDRIRRDKLRPTVSLPEFDIPAMASREDRYAAVELSMSIGAALAQLPAEQRAVVVALDVEGLSIAETAQRLGVAEGTVKSRSSRGRLRLAKLLGHLRDDS